MPLWSIFQSGNRPKGTGSSERGRCLLGTGRIGSDHCGVCFFASFGVIDRNRWRGFLWFLGRDARIFFVRWQCSDSLAWSCWWGYDVICDAGEGFRFRRRRYCQEVRGEKRCVENGLYPCVGHNMKTRNDSLKSCALIYTHPRTINNSIDSH